jgi:hypothetical protein
VKERFNPEDTEGYAENAKGMGALRG